MTTTETQMLIVVNQRPLGYLCVPEGGFLTDQHLVQSCREALERCLPYWEQFALRAKLDEITILPVVNEIVRMAKNEASQIFVHKVIAAYIRRNAVVLRRNWLPIQKEEAKKLQRFIPVQCIKEKR